jgi:pyruvate/2-oxoglutarate dehydrogenase complex dihydrolipoamide dehydrogenase (E3) component
MEPRVKITASLTKPDLCVIGAGAAGMAAAVGAVALGMTVVVIEKEGGGEGLHNPALVIEILREEASRVSRARVAGWPMSFDYDVFHARLHARLEIAASDRRLARLQAMNMRVIRGTGRFADDTRVTAGPETIRPKRTIIATGAFQPAPAWHGTSGLPWYAPDNLDDLAELPEHLVVFGGECRGLAAAQSLRRLGAAVTLMIDDNFMPGVDSELVEPLKLRLMEDGIVIRDRADIVTVDRQEHGFTITLRNGSPISGSHLLMAQKERPALSELQLDLARIDATDSGLVLTPSMRTSNRRVYAIGSAAGATSTQASHSQVGIVLRAAFFRLPVRFRPETIPRATATDPQIATVGLNETEARALGPVTLWRWPFCETDAGRATSGSSGHIKIIADHRGRILGVGIVGAAARDLIAFWSLAIKRKLNLRDLVDVAVPLPSLAEASRRAVLTHATGRLNSPWMRRATQFVKWLG